MKSAHKNNSTKLESSATQPTLAFTKTHLLLRLLGLARPGFGHLFDGAVVHVGEASLDGSEHILGHGQVGAVVLGLVLGKPHWDGVVVKGVPVVGALQKVLKKEEADILVVSW
jgi:hypothetical protein